MIQLTCLPSLAAEGRAFKPSGGLSRAMTDVLGTLAGMAAKLGHQTVGPRLVPDPQRQGAMVEAVGIDVLGHFKFLATLRGAPGEPIVRLAFPVMFTSEWVRQFHEAGLEGAHQQLQQLKLQLRSGRTVVEFSLDEQGAPRLVYFSQILVVDPSLQGLQRLADALHEMSACWLQLDALLRLRAGLDAGVTP